MPTQEITESWKEKVYEIKYTDQWFKGNDELIKAQETPTIENVRRAFAYVKMCAYGLLENKEYGAVFKKDVRPELNRIELILYGDKQNPEVVKAMLNYNIQEQRNPKSRTTTLINIQNVVSSLFEIHDRITKQWAYNLGFFVRKPYDRRYGMDGITEGLQA